MNRICKTLLVIVFILMFALWGFALYTDLQNVNHLNDGEFCLKNSVNKYEDGNVEICYGLGYRIYRYNRECLNGIEFASIFEDDRTLTMDECKN